MYISATGMACAVGLDADSACAALQAGISGFTELPYRDNSGEPILGAVVPDLDPILRRNDRVVEMIARAIENVLTQSPGMRTESIPLLIGLSEPERPGGAAGLAVQAIPRLQDRLSVRFHPASRAFATGHTAGFEALREARELGRTGLTTALVCGGDSLVNASTLAWLDRHQRLKTVEQSDGVIPGEAGAAALIRFDRPSKGTWQLRIAGMGFADESAHILNAEPLLALGLAAATRSALAEAAIGLHECNFRFSDVTGESYGFREQSLMMSRLQRVRTEDSPLWHPAESIGDTGAAAGVVQLVWAAHAFRGGSTPGANAGAFTSSVGGARATVVLRWLESP